MSIGPIDSYLFESMSQFAAGQVPGMRTLVDEVGTNYQRQIGQRASKQGAGDTQRYGVEVSISKEAYTLAKAEAAISGTSDVELTEEEQREVDQLKKRDREVRAHEAAHMAAGAGLITRGANFEYQVGPDGNRYAVGGDVQIDVSEEKDPEDTVRKMQRVQAAALAPAEPSAQDRRVAAEAAAKANQARMELAKEDDAAAAALGNSSGLGEASSSERTAQQQFSGSINAGAGQGLSFLSGIGQAAQNAGTIPLSFVSQSYNNFTAWMNQGSSNRSAVYA